MRFLLLTSILLLIMHNVHAQKQIRVTHYEKATAETYSVGDKLIYATVTDSSHIIKGIIERITTDSVYFMGFSERLSNMHTIYKKERWKKRLLYWGALNTVMLVPAFATVYGEMLWFAIPWFGVNAYFAVSGLHHLATPNDKYHILRDSEIRVTQ